ncbi:glycosyltransferase family 39 protein [Paenibacillus physcomitrellae]|uniref:Glycosyltransferase RgtA/B/C/D-like domain-containing protein n=1 Tax=Paenibacillus physcomitrellae TaxID=1619311 RepID=A0ABQ1GR90_9BACL|nr:glycosyltransferase family 39 protein [Paenibacillus physcomitrellae]GGA48561.1 hypothetical protein GCM10010917_37350 [Paenibacillus physcomitrellae]
MRGLSQAYTFCQQHRYTLLFFVLGVLLRILQLGSIPPGLNQDEASIGYDAFSILHYGIDRNSMPMPVHLIAWGSGQNALYAYLSMPFIAVMGLTPLSVRLLGVLAGIAAMPVFCLLARHLFRSQAAAPVAMLLIAINPWHIMMSRWALESNLFPTLVLFAVYCLVKALQSPRWFYAFTTVMAISLYAYGTAYFFVPVFLTLIAFLLFKRKQLSLRMLLLNFLLFIIIGLPILLFLLINWLNLPSIITPLLSIPRLTVPRVETVTTFSDGHFLLSAREHIHSFISLLLSGSDGLPWNSISPFGYAYPIGLPFALLGLIASIWALRSNREPLQAIILLWLGSAVLMVLIIEVNINRVNVIFYPIILLICGGVLFFHRIKKGLSILCAAAFLIYFSAFAAVYFRDYPKQISTVFANHLGDAIDFASASTPGTIYITNRINMPYIYVLFYEKTRTADFIKSVVYANPGQDFQQVSSFGRYRFGTPFFHKAQQAAYIFDEGDPLPPASSGLIFKRFGRYTVVLVL